MKNNELRQVTIFSELPEIDSKHVSFPAPMFSIKPLTSSPVSALVEDAVDAQ